MIQASLQKYYVDYVRQVSGTARVVRGNKGTQNTNIATMQRYFRSLQDDNFSGDNSFMYGKSTAKSAHRIFGGVICGEVVQIGVFIISKTFSITVYSVMKT